MQCGLHFIICLTGYFTPGGEVKQCRALPSALLIAKKIKGISGFKTLWFGCRVFNFFSFERDHPYFSEMRLPCSLSALLVLFLFSSSFPIFVFFMSSCVPVFLSDF